MGQKIHPKSLRIGVISTWDGKWYAQGKQYAKFIRQDQEIKDFLRIRLKDAGLDRIEIQRTPQSITIMATVAKPGVVIGKGGFGAEALREEVKKKFFLREKINFHINIVEVKNPSLSAPIVLHDMIQDIEKRMPYRRVMKHAIDKVMKAGAKGVKIAMGGRLDGVEIARREMLSQGSFPLHTLRADIDYAENPASTIYGAVGIKVWIYRGEVFKEAKQPDIL
jgi:small subunit ribosomal protein S3